MRILNFEDDDCETYLKKLNEENLFKGIVPSVRAQIRRAVRLYFEYVSNHTEVDNVEEGLELLIQEKEAGNPFDLIITDMHYPMRKGEEGDFDAGEKLLGILKERGIDTKVIICSSLNIKIREAYGCIWYSRISDWEMELLELMNQLKK